MNRSVGQIDNIQLSLRLILSPGGSLLSSDVHSRQNLPPRILHMNVTILDFAIIALPLVDPGRSESPGLALRTG